MHEPKTIQILLSDGTPNGIKTAEVGNRVGRAIVIPRNKVKDALKREDLNQVGLYFLIGSDEDEELPDLYIGEAEPLKKRLGSHHRKKDFWNVAICFISTNQSLTKASAKFLENLRHQEALKTHRYTLLNKVVPTASSLPEIEKLMR